MLFTKELLSMKKYWDSQPIQENSTIRLPEYRNNEDTSSVMETLKVTIPQKIKVSLDNRANDSDFLRYVIVFSALNICLSQYNEKELITVGSDLSFDTNSVDLSIPIVTEIDRDMTFKGLLEATRNLLMTAFKNKDYFNTVTNQNFNIFFHYRHVDNIATSHDIIITMESNELDNFITIKFNPCEYGKNTIESFVNHLFSAIESGLENLALNLMKFPKFEFSDSQTEKDSITTLVEKVLQEHRIVEKVKVFTTNQKNVEIFTAKVLAQKDAIRSNQLLKRYVDKKIGDITQEIEFIWVEDEKELFSYSTEIKEETRTKPINRPQTKKEKMILNVWREVLGTDSIDIEDNFFEIGGDSILSIQVYFKLKELGFNIAPKDTIAYPTIRELLVNVGVSENSIEAEQENITGTVPLSPSQHWFFEKDFENNNHYNDAWSYSLVRKLNPNFLEQTINSLILHHDMLRAKYKFDSDKWVQYIDDSRNQLCYQHYNFSNISEEIKPEKFSEIVTLHHKEINLVEGPLIKFIHIQNYVLEEDLLVIIGHRLIIDNFSMDIIIDDLQQIYDQVENNQPHNLKKTTSYKYWSENLTNYSNDLNMLAELDYWKNSCFDMDYQFPVDYINGGNYEETSEILYEVLDKDTTDYLYNVLPKQLRTSFRNILFSSLFHTISSWTGKNELLVESGGHGRESFANTIDLSRTVGWFTTNYPVYLKSTENHNFYKLLENIGQQLKEIPESGYHYGIIRYISNKEMAYLKGTSPKIGFDFQGNFVKSHNSQAYFKETKMNTGLARDNNNIRLYEFDVSTWIEDGKFVLRWSYSSARYQKSTITKLLKLFLSTLTRLHT